MTREASARQLVLKHAIRLIPDDGARPRYRCQECQLSWHGRRDEHPVDDTCGVSVLVRDAAAGEQEHYRYEGVYNARQKLVGQRAIVNDGHSGSVLNCPHPACIAIRQEPAAAGETREEEHDVTPTTTAGEVAAHPPRFPTLTAAGETREDEKIAADCRELAKRLRATRYEVHGGCCDDGEDAVPCASPICAIEYEAERQLLRAAGALAAARRDPSVGRRDGE